MRKPKMRGGKWTKYDCLKLIAAYRKHPVLYNKAHPDYNSQKDREQALMFIVDELQDSRPGTLLQEAKRRILNLRTQYFRQKKCVIEAAKHGKILKGGLWCYKDMAFIEDESILEDPLDMASVRNNTWFPDIDDDSLPEQFESVKPDENQCQNDTSPSPQPIEILEDIPASVTPIDDEVSSVFMEEELELLQNHPHESADEILTNLDTSDAQDITTPEKPIAKTQTRKRQAQKSLQTSQTTNSPISNKNSSRDKKELENKLDHLDNVTSEACELMGNCTNSEEAHNRAFVENLLYDLDELPVDVLQRVKWQITNEVFHASEQHKTKKFKSRA